MRSKPISYVYFIQQGKRGPIKIGIAKDPQMRMGELQTGSPRRLHIRRVMPTTAGKVRELEELLHDQFHHLHLHGEWFGPGTDLLEFIQHGTEPESRQARVRRALEGRGNKNTRNVVDISVVQSIRDGF